MQLDWKKLGVIALFVLAVFFFGFFIYWYFWRPILGVTEPGEPATTTAGVLPGAATGVTRATTTAAGGLPSAIVSGATTATGALAAATVSSAQKAVALVNDPAFFSYVTSDGTIVYYNSKDRKFYRVDADGKIVALSDQVFYNVSNAVFDHAGSKAVIEYPDGSNIIYDFDAEKQITLPAHWEDFGFSSSDQQIAFKNVGLNAENRFLVTAKSDGTGLKIIETIGENADLVDTNWSPNGQVVATYNTGSSAGQSEIFFIGENNENFKSLTVEGRGFSGLWSPDSSRMLYSVYDASNDYKPQLWISDASGDSIGNNRIKIELSTWVENCAFAGNSYAVCSAPKTMPYGAGLEPDVAAGIDDQLWAINLQTGKTSLIAQPENITDISKVMFSNDSPDSVFITNGSDNKIYKVSLTQ